MTPANSTFYSANMTTQNPIICGYLPLKTSIRPNSFNLFFGEFCIPAAFTSIACPVFYAISLICGSSVPPQIAQDVIFWIAVVMAALILFRWRANKRKKNKPMHFGALLSIVFPKLNCQPPIFSIFRKGFHLPALNRSNSSVVRNFINSFVSNYREPIFHNVPLNIPINNTELYHSKIRELTC